MAASVANFRLFTLDIVGSKTPILRLSFTSPLIRSNPYLKTHHKINQSINHKNQFITKSINQSINDKVNHKNQFIKKINQSQERIPSKMSPKIEKNQKSQPKLWKNIMSYHLRYSCSVLVCALLWKARSLATNSVASCAAFTDSVFGITNRARANSAIANCSRELWNGKIKQEF